MAPAEWIFGLFLAQMPLTQIFYFSIVELFSQKVESASISITNVRRCSSSSMEKPNSPLTAERLS